MPQPTVLFYDPGATPFAKHVPVLCAMQRIRLRPVRDADLNCPVGELALGKAIPVPPVDQPLPEPVLVFCGLTGPQLDWMLVGLRKQKAFCLKAVLTPDNAKWAFRNLYSELTKEREQLSK